VLELGIKFLILFKNI